ncbi:MAG: hypothetical protein ACOYU4_03510 [Thermodesulfobacteriota bacterium]
MKFHYWKWTIVILIVAFGVMIANKRFYMFKLPFFHPLDEARSINDEARQLLTEAKDILNLKSGYLTDKKIQPDVLKLKNIISSSLVLLEDQRRTLNEAKDHDRIRLVDVNTIAGTLIALVGTISTIILSWRKDVREARAETGRIRGRPL